MVTDVPPLPFSLLDAEQIVRRLGPALRDHGEWVQRVHTLLVCRMNPDPADLMPDSHRRSGLGVWLEHESNEFIRGQPEYAKATAYHRKVHELARELCEAVRDDAEIALEDYEKFAEAVAHLDRSLEALVNELWDLLRFTDPLTGIATRFAMLPRLKQERERIQRTGGVCSVCMVDLDRFKAINDTHGHEAGDRVLEAVSDYLVRNLRRYDQVCRYGGEEFVLMLPDTSPESAYPVVDRLRRGLAETPIAATEDEVIHMTASFGIAPLAADQDVAESIGHADAAMYQAKRAGRDKVRLWSKPDEGEADVKTTGPA